jgi:hypothetical protein
MVEFCAKASVSGSYKLDQTMATLVKPGTSGAAGGSRKSQTVGIKTSTAGGKFSAMLGPDGTPEIDVTAGVVI